MEVWSDQRTAEYTGVKPEHQGAMLPVTEPTVMAPRDRKPEQDLIAIGEDPVSTMHEQPMHEQLLLRVEPLRDIGDTHLVRDAIVERAWTALHVG